MSKKAIFPLVIFSAILLSACTAKTPIQDNQAEDNTSPDTEQSQTTSMRELMALGKSQKCTVSSSTTDDDGTKTESTGVMYFAGGKIAQEVVVTSTDKEMPRIEMSMVSDGSYMYTWNTQEKNQGMKMKITETANESDEDNTPQSGAVDMDDKLNVKCSPWIADNSKFSVPNDVQFTDLSEMMKNIPTMPANIPSGN